MTCGVYIINFGERSYVGSSRDVERRWNRHKSDLRAGRHANQFMQRLWDQGQEPTFALLASCGAEQLVDLEQHHVDQLKPYLNLAQVVAAPMVGRRHSVRSRHRMRQAQLARTDARRGWQPKPVLCVDTGQRFASATAAAAYLNRISGSDNNYHQNIAAACRGVTRTAYGYAWRYSEGE